MGHALEINLLEVEVDLFIDSLAELMGPVVAMAREEQGQKNDDSACYQDQGRPGHLPCCRYCRGKGSTQQPRGFWKRPSSSIMIKIYISPVTCQSHTSIDE